MSITITLPALSPTMETGTLAKWHKAEGDHVAIGDILFEIETDKATMEHESVEEGILGRILVPEGSEDVPVNEPVAILLEEGESAEDIDQPAPVRKSEDAEPDSSEAEGAPEQEKNEEKEKPAPAPADPAPQGGKQEAGKSKADKASRPPPQDGQGNRIFASPLARRLAGQNDLDLAAIEGSGPHGRIVKRDIEAVLSGEKPAAKAGEAAVNGAEAPRVGVIAGVDARAEADQLGMAYQAEKASKTRRTIARRLLQAHQSVPVFYLSVDCALDVLLATRKRLNEANELKISVNDFVIKAMAMALRKHPNCNTAWAETEILQYETIDISMAVAAEGGLITPIIRNADQKGLAEISAEARALAGKAREGKLGPQEYQGGTASISNLGMFGIKQFTAILNPPQSTILAVGAGEQRPVVRDGQIVVETIASLTLTCDHRTIDGAEGARLLGTIKQYLEDPAAMLV